MSEQKGVTLLNAYWLSLASKAAEIAYFLLLVSVLSKNELGQFNAMMALTLFFLTFLDFGLSQAGLRKFSQGVADPRAILRRSVPIRVVGLLMAFGALVASYIFGITSGPATFVLAILCGFQLVNVVQSIALSGLRGCGRQTVANQLGSFEAAAKLGALVALLFLTSRISIEAVVILLLLVKTAFCVISIRLLPPENTVSSPVGEVLTATLNPVLFAGQIGFLGIAVFTIVQNRLDWLMVSMFMDASSVASYSVVNRYYEILLFVLGIGFTTIYPWLCRDSQQPARDKHVLRVLRQLQFVPVPFMVALGIAGFPIINTLLWHGRYDDAIAVNAWMLPCAGLAVGNMMLYYDLMAKCKERLLLYFCVSSTVVQALVNAWAIPRYGIYGAVAGMWVMNIVNIALFSLARSRHFTSAGESIFTVSAAASISAGLIVMMQYLTQLALLLSVGIVSIIAGVTIWYLRDWLLRPPIEDQV